MAAESTKGRNLSGKVAIVTGSTEGIGFAIAERLGEAGAKVVISSRKPKRVEEVAEGLRAKGIEAIGISCHVGKEEQRQKLVDDVVAKWGKIDIFVANAAVSPYMGRTIDTPARAFDKLFEINLRAPFLHAQQIVPHMPHGSSIVFISSYGAFFAEPMIGIYSVTKTAMLGLTKALAKELASDGIRVNSICPGLIRTKFAGALLESDEAVKESNRNSFMARPGEPVECGGLVAFLCSDEASYITGENVVVAGGVSGRL